jgi:hypothetical protein
VVSEMATDDELAFEHIGTMECGERLLICDVDYFPERFAGMGRGAVSLGLELSVEPGTWQVLVARGSDGAIAVVLFTHDRELEVDTALEHADALGLLRVDTGRMTAIDPDLRADEVMQTAVIEAPREQVPCMLRVPGSDEETPPRGALLDVDAGGVFELHGHGEPCSAFFILVGAD